MIDGFETHDVADAMPLEDGDADAAAPAGDPGARAAAADRAPEPPSGLAHRVALSAQEAHAALAEAVARDRRWEQAMLERTLAARAATAALLELARGRAAAGGILRARIATLLETRRGGAPGRLQLVRKSGLFAAAWYAQQHRAELRGTTPIDHYLARGMAANLAPNPFFDPGWYVARHKDAAASGEPAIMHYLTAGARQLLAPGPLFSAIAYDARYPDLKRVPDLLAHYLAKGMFEGREAIPERVPYLD